MADHVFSKSKVRLQTLLRYRECPFRIPTNCKSKLVQCSIQKYRNEPTLERYRRHINNPTQLIRSNREIPSSADWKGKRGNATNRQIYTPINNAQSQHEEEEKIPTRMTTWKTKQKYRASVNDTKPASQPANKQDLQPAKQAGSHLHRHRRDA